MLRGQAGIRFREAMVARDVPGMVAQVPLLDQAHHVELILGEALRDARRDFATARLYLENPDPARICAALVEGVPDRHLDDLAAAYVASRRAPDRWVPGGRALDRPLREHAFRDIAVAAALIEGVGGDSILDTFADLPLFPAVDHYYRVGTIHALGCRPLLILAATAG